MGALRRIAASTASRIAGVCLLVLAGAVAALLALGGSGAVPALAPSAPVEVAAGFAPSVAQFGDRILARVTVALDTRRVRPQTLRLADDLSPFTQLGAAQTSHLTQGRLELLTVVVPVSCLSAPCVGRGDVTRVGLPRVHVSVLARDGGITQVSAAWPTVSIRGRVTASDLAAHPLAFEAGTVPPAPTYRIAPATLGALLDLLAALCALGAVGFAGWEAHLRIERRRREPSALERALRLTREAERRPAPDRRRALALLGRVLDRDERSSAVRRLAWSKPVPEPDELEELLSDLEQGSAG